MKKLANMPLPPIVYAEASVHSLGGVSLFATTKPITRQTINEFYADTELNRQAVKLLRQEGFRVLNVSPVSITIAAPATIFAKVFKTKIIAEEKPTIKEFGQADTATFLDCPDTALPGLIDTSRSRLKNVLEGVALNKPVYYFSPSPFPPKAPYWHLTVPDGVSRGLKADKARELGFTGQNIKVVMVDSGWYQHPFFKAHGYKGKVVLGPAATNPEHDEHGHGTGESANIFSVASDVDFTMVKMNFVNSVGAFNKAVALKPDVISCSWGSTVESLPLSAADRVLAAAVASAVASGIIVVFSAGNGHWGFPGQHPDVIAAGGVFMHPDGSLEATPYASGFESKVFPGRLVPDVCGLVGLPPRAQYIMLPVEPGNQLDRDLAGGTHPNGDQTTVDDGWAAFSGTSAAAPQLAGICALMKQAHQNLTPLAAKKILKNTAKDVAAGNASPATGGHPATPGIDLATGSGLANAYEATKAAAVKEIEAVKSTTLKTTV